MQNQTVSIDVSMKVGSLSEEVTVKGETPVVDTKSASVATNLDAMLLDTTPGGKDIWSILEYKIPGLVFDLPDVGGNQAGLQRAFTSRGTPNSQNVQLVNGVNVGDPGGDRVLDELLRTGHVRERAGHDRRAGHLDGHVRHADQHGHPRRARIASAARPVDLSGQADAVGQRG